MIIDHTKPINQTKKDNKLKPESNPIEFQKPQEQKPTVEAPKKKKLKMIRKLKIGGMQVVNDTFEGMDVENYALQKEERRKREQEEEEEQKEKFKREQRDNPDTSTSLDLIEHNFR